QRTRDLRSFPTRRSSDLELTAVRLYDPLEMELPDLGMVTVQDAETGEQVLVDTHDRRFRKRFAFIAEQREKALRSAFRQAGVDRSEEHTSELQSQYDPVC